MVLETGCLCYLQQVAMQQFPMERIAHPATENYEFADDRVRRDVIRKSKDSVVFAIVCTVIFTLLLCWWGLPLTLCAIRLARMVSR